MSLAAPHARRRKSTDSRSRAAGTLRSTAPWPGAGERLCSLLLAPSLSPEPDTPKTDPPRPLARSVMRDGHPSANTGVVWDGLAATARGRGSHAAGGRRRSARLRDDL